MTDGGGTIYDDPLLNGAVVGVEFDDPGVANATGATAGIPGSWTPAGAEPPAGVAELQGGIPNVVVASPATPWTSGQYVQTKTDGAAGRACWTGTSWVGGAAPLEASEPEPEPEP